MDIPVGHDYRCELQSHAKFLERNGYRGKSGAGLHDGKGELTTCQEAGFLAIDRDQVRLGENLQETFIFKSLDGCAKIDVGTKEKKIQDIADGCSGSCGYSARTRRRRLGARGQCLRTEAAV